MLDTSQGVDNEHHPGPLLESPTPPNGRPQMSMSLTDAILAAARGRRMMVRCPAHDDGNASLSVGPGTDHPVVLHCHAGCETQQIMEAEGIDWSEIMAKDPTEVQDRVWTPAGDASHVYSYCDEEGTEVFQVLRIPQPGGKTFRQRHWDAAQDKWVWNTRDVRRCLYRLPEVARGVEEGETIWWLEGEKDVEAARLDGLVATCNPMGAGKWEDEWAEALRDSYVVIVTDADEAGRTHARAIAEKLVAVDAEVQIRESMIGKDYAEHRAKGGTADSLTVVWRSRPERPANFGMGIQDFLRADWKEDDEVIPGHLGRSNVVIITGWEGHGKSTFMRQMAVCTAGGLNPFEFTPMEPLKVMFVDAENPEHQQVFDWRKLAGLVAHHTGQEVPNDNLIILSEWENEPDLTSTPGAAWLYERVQAYQPDLILMGPAQNLVQRDLSDDNVVRKLKQTVNTARAMCGSAFIIEHHSPWKQQGDKERSTRPYGSSLFNKWPDFGYGLRPDPDRPEHYDLVPNRNPRVRRRAWPDAFRWGRQNTAEFPWEVASPEEAGQVYRGNFG